jgi:hypothetical protein
MDPMTDVDVTREDGLWLAESDRPPFATFARTLEKLREYVADAIALSLEVEAIDRGERDPHVDRGSVKFEFRFKDPTLRNSLMSLERARDRAASGQAAAAQATEETIRRLASLGISTRDTAELVGLSQTRVAQLART